MHLHHHHHHYHHRHHQDHSYYDDDPYCSTGIPTPFVPGQKFSNSPCGAAERPDPELNFGPVTFVGF